MSEELMSMLIVGNNVSSHDNDDGDEDADSQVLQCSACLKSSSSLQVSTSLSCSRGVCQQCQASLAAGDESVVCVKCHIRSVSPSSAESSPRLRASSPRKPRTSSRGMPREKQRIVQQQLAHLLHLDDVVYKLLIRHFDRLLANVNKGATDKVRLIESNFEDICTAAKERKDYLIGVVKRSAKNNNLSLKTKREEAIQQRDKLQKYCKVHDEKTKSASRCNGDHIELSSFLNEVQEFCRRARHTCTSNATTTLNEIDIQVKDKCSIKNSVDRLFSEREVTIIYQSRLGTPKSTSKSTPKSTPKSSPVSSLEEEAEMVIPHANLPPDQSVDGILLLAPIDTKPRNDPNATLSVLTRVPSASTRLSVSTLKLSTSPREITFAADGAEIGIEQPGRLILPKIKPPSPKVRSRIATHASQQSLSLRGSLHNDECDDDDQLSLPLPLTSKDSDHCHTGRSLCERRDRSGKRNQDTLQHGRKVSGIKKKPWTGGHCPPPKLAQLLERPNGICCHINQNASLSGNGSIVWVADCGSRGIGIVGSDGRSVTNFRSPWVDDGGLVKAQGVFDVTAMADGSMIVSDSQEKKVLRLQGDRPAEVIEGLDHIDPRGVASHGHCVYICDRGNHCLQMVDLSPHPRGGHNNRGSRVIPISLGESNDCLPIDPYFVDVCDRDGQLLVTDYSNHELIAVCAHNSTPLRRAKLHSSWAASPDIRPTGVAWLPDGSGAVIADQKGHRLVVVDQDLAIVGTFGEEGSGPGEFRFPHGLVFTAADTLAVCDMNNSRVQYISLNELLGRL